MQLSQAGICAKLCFPLAGGFLRRVLCILHATGRNLFSPHSSPAEMRGTPRSRYPPPTLADALEVYVSWDSVSAELNKGRRSLYFPGLSRHSLDPFHPAPLSHLFILERASIPPLYISFAMKTGTRSSFARLAPLERRDAALQALLKAIADDVRRPTRAMIVITSRTFVALHFGAKHESCFILGEKCFLGMCCSFADGHYISHLAAPCASAALRGAVGLDGGDPMGACCAD